MRRLFACAVLAGVVLHGAAAAEDGIRMWGHGSRDADHAGALVSAWERGFTATHPGARLSHTLRGTSTAMGGLYTGAADLALMQRAPIAIEIDAWKPIFNADPFEVVVAAGSLDIANHNPALVVLVHRDNPLRQLTLAQLDAIVGADHRRGGAPVLRWGDLGLNGAWAERPITVLTPSLTSDDSGFVEQTVMKGSQKWVANVREFPLDSGEADASRQIGEALAKDRYAIAISTLVHRHRDTRALALSSGPGGPYLAPTRATVAAQTYPLARHLSIFLRHDAATPFDPAVRDYLRFILGDQGQAAIRRDGGYLPLPADTLRRERSKLE